MLPNAGCVYLDASRLENMLSHHSVRKRVLRPLPFPPPGQQRFFFKRLALSAGHLVIVCKCPLPIPLHEAGWARNPPVLFVFLSLLFFVCASLTSQTMIAKVACKAGCLPRCWPGQHNMSSLCWHVRSPCARPVYLNGRLVVALAQFSARNEHCPWAGSSQLCSGLESPCFDILIALPPQSRGRAYYKVQNCGRLIFVKCRTVVSLGTILARDSLLHGAFSQFGVLITHLPQSRSGTFREVQNCRFHCLLSKSADLSWPNSTSSPRCESASIVSLPNVQGMSWLFSVSRK